MPFQQHFGSNNKAHIHQQRTSFQEKPLIKIHTLTPSEMMLAAYKILDPAKPQPCLSATTELKTGGQTSKEVRDFDSRHCI